MEGTYLWGATVGIGLGVGLGVIGVLALLVIIWIMRKPRKEGWTPQEVLSLEELFG